MSFPDLSVLWLPADFSFFFELGLLASGTCSSDKPEIEYQLELGHGYHQCQVLLERLYFTTACVQLMMGYLEKSITFLLST